jgi:cytochrome bd-type quinol oxidase subunit 2
MEGEAVNARQDAQAFEKARYEYCLSLYERETARKDALERKAQLYLTLLALFVGAVFLKIDVLTGLSGLLNSSDTGSSDRVALLASAIVFSTALLASLLAVLIAIHVRGYAIEYPVQLVRALFETPSTFLPEADAATLHSEAAHALATAFEEDRRLNDRKAHWISVSAYALFGMLFALATFMAILAHVALR